MDGGKKGRWKETRRWMGKGMLAGVVLLAMAAAAAVEEVDEGFITVPVVQGWRRRRELSDDNDHDEEQGSVAMAQRGLLEEETGVNGSSPALAGKVVTLSEDFGQYFAVFQLGTPPVMAALIIDTGSQLLWVQCQPCIECGPQAEGYPVFNPRTSSTYKNITCNSNEEICPDNDSVASSCESSRCIYRVTYGDHSNSTGYLSKETLTTSTTTGSSFSKDNIIFGCGILNNGLEAELNASGLLGLDRGEFSLITQLNVSIFSYCLPNRVHTTEVSGKLTLGKRPSSGLILQYTPMIQITNPSFRSQFYYINLTGISVNGSFLQQYSKSAEGYIIAWRLQFVQRHSPIGYYITFAPQTLYYLDDITPCSSGGIEVHTREDLSSDTTTEWLMHRHTLNRHTIDLQKPPRCPRHTHARRHTHTRGHRTPEGHKIARRPRPKAILTIQRNHHHLEANTTRRPT